MRKPVTFTDTRNLVETARPLISDTKINSFTQSNLNLPSQCKKLHLFIIA